jgi:hypothetical protein
MKKISKKIVVLRDKSAEFERQVMEKTFGYIVTSFGLVAGLAWNDAIKALIENYFPLQNDTMKAKFVYATAITMVVVFISLYLARLFKKDAKVACKEEKETEAQTKATKK